MTNGAFVASPVLPSGIGTIYFQAGLIVGGSGTIMVQVSTNNGANWIVLQTYTITGSGSAWNDISPAIQLNLRVPAMVQIVETNTIFSQQIILDNIAITYPGYVEIGSSASQLTGCPSGAVATTDTRYLAALTNVAAFDPAGAAAVVQTNLNAVGATQAVNTATISVLTTNTATLAYVVGVSNGAIAVSAAAITAATNGLVTASVTNGLASTAALVSGLTAGSNYAVTVANAASNVLSAVWQPGTPIYAASGTATIYYASGPLVSLVCTAATTIVVDPARAGYGSTNGLNQQVLMLLQATNSVSWGAAGNTFAIPYTLTATNAWTRYMIDCIGTNTFSVYGGLQ
jgi:hypothetical protein